MSDLRHFGRLVLRFLSLPDRFAGSPNNRWRRAPFPWTSILKQRSSSTSGGAEARAAVVETGLVTGTAGRRRRGNLNRRRLNKVRSKSIRARPGNSKIGAKCLRRITLRAFHQHIDIDPRRTTAGVRTSGFAALQQRRASVAKFLIPPIDQFSRNRARRFGVHQELKPGAPSFFIRSRGAIAQNDGPIVPVDGCLDPRITVRNPDRSSQPSQCRGSRP